MGASGFVGGFSIDEWIPQGADSPRQHPPGVGLTILAYAVLGEPLTVGVLFVRLSDELPAAYGDCLSPGSLSAYCSVARTNPLSLR